MPHAYTMYISVTVTVTVTDTITVSCFLIIFIFYIRVVFKIIKNRINSDVLGLKLSHRRIQIYNNHQIRRYKHGSRTS